MRRKSASPDAGKCRGTRLCTGNEAPDCSCCTPTANEQHRKLFQRQLILPISGNFFHTPAGENPAAGFHSSQSRISSPFCLGTCQETPRPMKATAEDKSPPACRRAEGPEHPPPENGPKLSAASPSPSPVFHAPRCLLLPFPRDPFCSPGTVQGAQSRAEDCHR